ncbi:unnamed protein product, partial [Iphiclides podalirius]
MNRLRTQTIVWGHGVIALACTMLPDASNPANPRSSVATKRILNSIDGAANCFAGCTQISPPPPTRQPRRALSGVRSAHHRATTQQPLTNSKARVRVQICGRARYAGNLVGYSSVLHSLTSPDKAISEQKPGIPKSQCRRGLPLICAFAPSRPYAALRRYYYEAYCLNDISQRQGRAGNTSPSLNRLKSWINNYEFEKIRS